MGRKYFALFILAFCMLILISPAEAKTFKSEVINDSQKSWNIEFNKEVNPTIDSQTIYILADNGEKHPVSLLVSDDHKRVTVKPLEPFLLGTNYTLIVTKEVESLQGGKLKEESKLSFKVEGDYIQSVQAAVNPFVTNVRVQGTKDVQKMTISVNNSEEITLHPYVDSQFNRGALGLVNGDILHIQAYDEQGHLLEKQTYKVTN